MSSYRSGLRIIGGRWKGRKIQVADVPGLRPTSDRIRETLFNWLSLYIEGARCLDLFAGSGALSLEALSRGADHATAVDSQRRSVQAIRAAADLLGADNLVLMCDDALRALQVTPDKAYDLVFVDPPFGFADYERVLDALQTNGWLATNALVYVESDKNHAFASPEVWKCLKTGQAGKVSYRLFSV